MATIIEELRSKSTIKRFQDILRKTALKENQSYADSFENSGLKRKETSAFKNIIMIAHQASGSACLASS